MSIEERPEQDETAVASLQGVTVPDLASEAVPVAPRVPDGYLVGEHGPELAPAPDNKTTPLVSPLQTEHGNGLVKIAYLHRDQVSHSWHESMARLWHHDLWGSGRVTMTEGPVRVACSGPNGLVAGRNTCVSYFLDNTEHEWLLFIDTDMGFRPDAVDRLVEAADPVERPVVGALCFAYLEKVLDGYGGRRYEPVPTLFNLAKSVAGHVGFVHRYIYPENALVQVAGTGAAFLLIHRTVLQRMRDQHGDSWFDLVAYGDGQPVSEDLSFCWRVSSLGLPVFVHTGVKTTHHKALYVSEADYQMPETEPQWRGPHGTAVDTQ